MPFSGFTFVWMTYFPYRYRKDTVRIKKIGWAYFFEILLSVCFMYIHKMCFIKKLITSEHTKLTNSFH